jgi:hypothetical protein
MIVHPVLWHSPRCDLIEVMSRDFPGENEEIHGKHLRIIGVQGEIRTENLPNSSLDQPLLFFYFNI